MTPPSSVLLKGLQELMASSQVASGPGSPSSSSSSSLQIRLTRLDESVGPAPGSVTALQIPLQITHLGEDPRRPLVPPPPRAFTSCLTRLLLPQASDSSTAAGDGDAITLNAGALQTFELLPVSGRRTDAGMKGPDVRSV